VQNYDILAHLPTGKNCREPPGYYTGVRGERMGKELRKDNWARNGRGHGAGLCHGDALQGELLSRWEWDNETAIPGVRDRGRIASRY